jgi:hypothetical protein
MSILGLQNILIAAAVSITVGFGGGWYVKGKFVKADKADELADAIKDYKGKQASADTAAAGWEKELTTLRLDNQRLNRRIQNEISSKPIYTSCVVPSDGVRALADAVSGAGESAGEPGK